MNSRGKSMRAAAVHWREAYGLAWALVGDHARAEELAQEAFVRLGGMQREPDSDRPVRQLLLSIVRNLALDELRRRRTESLDLALQEGAQIVDRGNQDPAQLALGRERTERLQEILAQLKPTWRAMLYLKDGLDHSYRQIAETLGKSEDVVRVTLHRARARVRELSTDLDSEGGNS
ncbi:MAG: RNA polymerase sigma-70 factor (ECF subfamily) [Planctomycetota bacterium]|jgi:RNA polymerase sigma-70 factor (ECF subfamily)